MTSIRDMKELAALKKLLQGLDVRIHLTLKISKKMARQKRVIPLN
jgi:hypothetical protein